MFRIIILFALFLTETICSQTSYDVVFKNASVLTLKGNEILKNKSVAISKGKIAVIANTQGSKLKGTKEIDLKGQYIMPSLADAHVHLPETEPEMEQMLQFYLLNGVTKLRSMRGDWKHKEWKEKFNTTVSRYPKLYLSAPPLNRKMELTAETIEKYVSQTKENGFDFIKILSVKDENTFVKVDSICKKYSIALAGHFPYTKPAIKDETIFSSNYTSMEHLAGLAGEPSTLESRIQAIKQKQMYICPTLTWYSVGSGRYTYDELRKLPGMEFIPTPTVEKWLTETKEYRDKLGEVAYKQEVETELKKLDEKYTIIKKLHESGVPMLLSPDASSKYLVQGFSMIEEMKLLQKAKLSNAAILKMATLNFASFFKANYGEIQEGKEADFIITKENPLENLETLKDIRGVYFNATYLSPKDLDNLRNSLLKWSRNI